jgi:hypothetical protein
VSRLIAGAILVADLAHNKRRVSIDFAVYYS